MNWCKLHRSKHVLHVDRNFEKHFGTIDLVSLWMLNSIAIIYVFNGHSFGHLMSGESGKRWFSGVIGTGERLRMSVKRMPSFLPDFSKELQWHHLFNTLFHSVKKSVGASSNPTMEKFWKWFVSSWRWRETGNRPFQGHPKQGNCPAYTVNLF